RGHPLLIVHRDVSPQNVMVGSDGVACVLDFGIAKAVAKQSETLSTDIKGKVRYMAPEQLLREDIDARVDLYAAGVVLWELLVGDRLFEASSEGALVAKVLAGLVLPPSQYAPEVSKELDAVVLRAVSLAPTDRQAKCSELAAALRAVA